MKNELYNFFLEHKLTESLEKLDITSSNFVCNWKEILTDEEFIDYNTNKIVKCVHCESSHIKNHKMPYQSIFNLPNLYLDFLNKLKMKESEILKLQLLTVRDGYANIDYCANCSSILNINNKPFFINYYLTSSDYIELFQKENYYNTNILPIKCPYCNKQGISDVFTTNVLNKPVLIWYCIHCRHYLSSSKENGDMYFDLNELGNFYGS